ncbi:uncharacterized protein [Anabrus simplex]|uniref:uncharacterized protein n=1 Tax=Anabrus simplex TaxID=316456 RepID=UPI0034DCD169
MTEVKCSPPRNLDILMKTRNAACRLKGVSPDFRLKMRKLFMNRMKENRNKYLDLFRNAPEQDVVMVLKDTIWQEAMDICKSSISKFEITNPEVIDDALSTLEEIEDETLQEEVEQLLQDYDELSACGELSFTAEQLIAAYDAVMSE